jgi:hypothetical protein
MTVRELVTKLGWDVDNETIKRYDAAVDKAKIGLLALTGAATAAGAALVAVTISAAKAGEELLAQSEVTGLSVEEYQQYAFAAQQAEVSNEEFATSVRFLTRNMGDALRGSGEAGKAFSQLGIRLTDANGKTRATGDVLRDVTAGFRRIQDPALRASLSLDLFGRGGARMGRFLAQNPEAFERAAAAVRRFGFFTGDSAQEADEAGDALGLVLANVRGLKNELGQKLFPVMRELSERLDAWFAANEAIIRQKIDQFARGVGRAFTLALRGAELLERGIRALVGLLGGFDNMVKLVGLGLVALGLTFAALAAVPLILFAPVLLVLAKVAAAIFTVLLVLEDLYVFARGGDSIFGQLLDRFQNIKQALDGLGSVVAGFFQFLVGGVTGNSKLIEAALDEMIKGIINLFSGSAKAIANAIAYPFELAWQLIRKALPDWAVRFLRGATNITATPGAAGFGGGLGGGFGGPQLAAAGLAGGFAPAALIRAGAGGGRNVTATATVQNYVTVPPGTPREQVLAIKEAIREVTAEELRKNYDHVLQENPER